MNFVNGMIYGAGFTFAAILVAVAMRAVFHFGIC